MGSIHEHSLYFHSASPWSSHPLGSGPLPSPFHLSSSSTVSPHSSRPSSAGPGSSPEPQVAPSQHSPHPQLPQRVFTLPCRCSQRLPACPGTVVPSLRNREVSQTPSPSQQASAGGRGVQAGVTWHFRFPSKSCLSAALRRGGESVPVYWQSPAKVREDRRSPWTRSRTRSRTSSLGLEGRGQRETTWVQVRPL